MSFMITIPLFQKQIVPEQNETHLYNIVCFMWLCATTAAARCPTTIVNGKQYSNGRYGRRSASTSMPSFVVLVSSNGYD
jgi:hypothetical protein